MSCLSVEQLPSLCPLVSVIFPCVRQTAKVLARQVLTVSMNLEQPWVLQPWHLSVAFRKAGFVVPETCLEMPAAAIEGPDVEGLEDKEFIVNVTVSSRAVGFDV